MKSIFRKILPHLVSVLAFLIVSSVYFYPAWEGKSLQGEDVIGSFGSAREKKDALYFENETVLWNGSIFSGMPDLVFAPFKGATQLKKIYLTPVKLGIPLEISSVLWYMIGFYILLLSLSIRPYISAGGAIAFALSTYYIVIIMAGHYMKVDTLAMIPPTLAGILLVFKRKYLWGFILTTFFLAVQINMAHVQMIYYFLFSLLILGFVELYFHIKEKQIKNFIKAVAILAGAAIMAIAPNSAKLLTYYNYNDYSIRGRSELTVGQTGPVTETDGLDKDYINMWSSGVDESMMVIVPNVKGGSTGMVKSDRSLLNKVPRQYRETIGNLNQYWGDQPFSGGPNYLGIVFVFLFVLGAFLLPGRLKITAIASVILFFFLSLGGSFPTFTNLFIDYVPMYNKFRAPVSILALAMLWIGLVGVFALHKIYTDKAILDKKTKIPFLDKEYPTYLIVTAIFLAFLLLNIAFPHLLNSFMSKAENNQFNSLRSQPNVGNQVDALIVALTDFRVGVFRADLWRSLLFVIITVISIHLYRINKIKPAVVAAVVVLLAIIDFWGVSRRYVPLNHFTKKGAAVKQAHQLTENDRRIYQLEMRENPEITNKINEITEKFKPANKEEQDRILTYAVNKYSHYRVFNLVGSPFQENITSNAHSSIGGYHALKLRRYQDMIEQYIGKMNMPVLDMLDTKYFFTQNGLQQNPNAMGAAWFVDSVLWVNNANDEILALDEVNLQNTVVIRERDKIKLGDFYSGNEGKINLINYSPDELTYKTENTTDQIAVFSEIYYPGWKVYIDGVENKLFEANYILRGLVVPEGKHLIEFKFHPEYYYISNRIAQISFYILIFILLAALGFEVYRERDKLKNLLS